jgi:hypothetical protein
MMGKLSELVNINKGVSLGIPPDLFIVCSSGAIKESKMAYR